MTYVAALLCAQMTAVHRIEIGSEIFELAGVCRISERDFAAWDPKGNRSPKLEEFVSTWLQNDHRLPQLTGRKIRFALFTWRNRPPYERDSFENDRLTNLSQYGNRYRVAIVIAPSGAKFGSVSLLRPKDGPVSGLLRAQKGGHIQYMARTFRILGWNAAPPPNGLPASRTRSSRTWTVTVEVKPPMNRNEAPLAWHPVGKDDLYVRAIGKEGNPIFAPASMPLDSDPPYSYGGPLAEDETLAGTLHAGWDSKHPTWLRITTNVDPAQIAGYKIKGTFYDKYTFTKIPMDPRGSTIQ